MRFFDILAQLPSPAKWCVNGTAIGTLVGSWLAQIHGPAVTVGVILAAIWTALQIFLAVERRWFRKDK